ncbi:hypothetical protein BD779DRAFT_1552870 [Infundibulicybe gibba]|nr:hypothetical protein BD779DRAFT_1552870 [Infundibulicybe gibba]
MPIELPGEILGLIITVLTRQHHPLQYGYRTSVRRTLHQLCLVSHLAYVFAAPLLYQSIVVRTHTELARLHRTRTQFNAADSFSSFHPTVSLSIHTLRGNDRTPRLLADLINLSRHSLQRLSLDTQLSRESPCHNPAVLSALSQCHHLHEFSTTLLHMTAISLQAAAARWPALRRLALDGVFPADTLIAVVSVLPSLTHLLLLAPAGHETVRALLHRARRLQRLVLVHETERMFQDQGPKIERLAARVQASGRDMRVVQLRFGDLGRLWEEFGTRGQSLSHGTEMKNHVEIGMLWDVGEY